MLELSTLKPLTAPRVKAEKTAFDLDRVRADFPILATRIHGHSLAYLDNAASAQKPCAVLEAIETAYTQTYANVHRGMHELANLATDAFEEARGKVQRFLNAPSANQIVFTKSATEAINLVASSFGAAHLAAGDEVVLTMMEHHSNIVPWHFLRERQGVVLRWVDVYDDGGFSLEAFEQALTPRTKIVAVTHMSNVLGTVTPIADIVKLCHARGIAVLVDGSQGAVHCKVDVVALGMDFYIITGHKLYGPSGIGALYAKGDWLNQLPPYQGGGEMIDTVTCDSVTYNTAPHRFEAGTPPIVQAIGLGAALDYITTIGHEAMSAQEQALGDYAMARLSAIKGLRILGRAPGKGAIVTFVTEGAHSDIHAYDIATMLDQSGIAVRAGTHCTMPLHARFGITASCRASFAFYNSLQEVDRLAEGLEKTLAFFKR